MQKLKLHKWLQTETVTPAECVCVCVSVSVCLCVCWRGGLHCLTLFKLFIHTSVLWGPLCHRLFTQTYFGKIPPLHDSGHKSLNLQLCGMITSVTHSHTHTHTHMLTKYIYSATAEMTPLYFTKKILFQISTHLYSNCSYRKH